MNNTTTLVLFGALAVAFYLIVGLAGHRNTGRTGTLLDYSVLIPRALPGLIVGLAFFWLFLFVPFLTPLRPTLISLFVAYVVVGLSYGLRLLPGASDGGPAPAGGMARRSRQRRGDRARKHA